MKTNYKRAFIVLVVVIGIALSVFFAGKWISSLENPADLSNYAFLVPDIFYERGIRKRYKLKNFDDIFDDFQVMVDLVSPYRETLEKAEYNNFAVSYDTDYDCISSTAGVIELTPDQQNSLRTIADAYASDAGSMTLIGFEPGQIKFLSEWKCYAIVYTDDDVAPTTLWFPESDVRVKKIRPHWYHVFDVN